jgi:hypothetical protein
MAQDTPIQYNNLPELGLKLVLLGWVVTCEQCTIT